MFGLPKTRAGLDENGHLAWAFERYLLEFDSELINTPYVLQLGLLGETRLLQLGHVAKRAQSRFETRVPLLCRDRP